MRILHVSAQKPDSTGSGVYLASLERSFAKLGHINATICGVDVTDEPEQSLPPNSGIYPVRFNTPALPFPVCGMSDMMPYSATRYRDLTPAMTESFLDAYRAAIERADREFEPDLVVCHHLYLVTALVRRTLPHRKVVAICHSTDLRQLTQHGLKRDYITEAIRDLDGIAALHEQQRLDIASFFGIDLERIGIIGIGYDSSLFRLPEQDPRRAPQHEKTLLYVGKIGFKKGVLSLVNAYETLLREGLDATLQLVGGFSNREEYDLIAEKASSLSRPPLLLGEMKPKALAPVYRNADVFVLPSFFEGLPLVIAEALASGCKVAATDLPGVRPFYEQFVPGAPLWFVTPPPLRNLDTPDPADLPAFERNLADALLQALDAPVSPCDPTVLSWDNVCRRLLDYMQMGMTS